MVDLHALCRYPDGTAVSVSWATWPDIDGCTSSTVMALPCLLPTGLLLRGAIIERRLTLGLATARCITSWPFCLGAVDSSLSTIIVKGEWAQIRRRRLLT